MMVEYMHLDCQLCFDCSSCINNMHTENWIGYMLNPLRCSMHYLDYPFGCTMHSIHYTSLEMLLLDHTMHSLHYRSQWLHCFDSRKHSLHCKKNNH